MVLYDRVKNLHSWRSAWKIQVKVLRKWRKVSDGYDTLELIFVDVFGDKIQATVGEDLFQVFNNLIAENEWKIFRGFSVCLNDRLFKHTDSDYRIMFNDETIVENSAAISNNHFLDFQTFDRVFEGYHAVRNLPIDIMGEVVNVETLIHVHNPNLEIPTEMVRILRFGLRDLSGVLIQCVAYNEVADFFSNNWLVMGYQTHIVAVLQFLHVRYQSGGQRMELYSTPMVSKIGFDPDIAEVEDFKRRLAYNEGSEDYGSD